MSTTASGRQRPDPVSRQVATDVSPTRSRGINRSRSGPTRDDDDDDDGDDDTRASARRIVRKRARSPSDPSHARRTKVRERPVGRATTRAARRAKGMPRQVSDAAAAATAATAATAPYPIPRGRRWRRRRRRHTTTRTHTHVYPPRESLTKQLTYSLASAIRPSRTREPHSASLRSVSPDLKTTFPRGESAIKISRKAGALRAERANCNSMRLREIKGN